MASLPKRLQHPLVAVRESIGHPRGFEEVVKIVLDPFKLFIPIIWANLLQVTVPPNSGPVMGALTDQKLHVFARKTL